MSRDAVLDMIWLSLQILRLTHVRQHFPCVPNRSRSHRLASCEHHAAQPRLWGNWKWWTDTTSTLQASRIVRKSLRLRQMADSYGQTAGSPESSPHSDNESGGHYRDHDASVREQDRFLPIANVSRIMKKALPSNAKISKDAKETVQECVSEFISFITGISLIE